MLTNFFPGIMLFPLPKMVPILAIKDLIIHLWFVAIFRFGDWIVRYKLLIYMKLVESYKSV